MKKLLALIPVLLIAIGYFNMPQVISAAIPSVYYITPNTKTYENVVNCQGTVQSQNVRDIFLQSTLVPEEVCVEVGDNVAEGDLLMRVDKSATEKLSMSPQKLLTELADDAASNKNNGAVDWLALASDFGLTAALSGGGVDFVQLQSALQSGNVSDAASTNVSVVVAENSPEKIMSPIKGTVTEVNIRADAPTSVGKAVFTIADTDNFKVIAQVGEGDIAKINIGDKASVRGVGFGGSVYGGVVTKIFPTARKSLTGSETVVDVEIMLLKTDKNLKPGFSAKVEITGGNNFDLITVPYEAVRQDENNNEYIYVYVDGKLKKQVIITGQELTNDVEILSPIAENTVVVYNPNDLIKEGSMINLKGRANIAP